MRPFVVIVFFLTAMIMAAGPTAAQGKSILVQSTTSTANSGLYDHLLPAFTEETGITVHVVAVGTGQAIKNARNCDADVLLVHARASEEKFVDDGFGEKRFDLMYNDFVIVGPASDPAEISGTNNVKAALKKIAVAEIPFASRGDDSGTHKKEMSLWAAVGVTPGGAWYHSTGSGMGATLNVGVAMNAYVMTDRATWISFGNKDGHKVAVEGDEAMFNQYGVILVNPQKCPDMKAAEGREFIKWLLSAEGQNKIRSFRIDGRQLFFPNADATGM